MHLEFSGQHVSISPRRRDFTAKKLHRLEKHFDHITDVHVFYRVHGSIHHVEATVHASASDRLYAESSASTFESAINELAQKLDRQIIRHKEKLKNHRQ